MSVVLVDWLGRGGIAQCSEAWARELEAVGAEVTVATRADRELVNGRRRVVTVEAAAHPILTHRRLVQRAAEVIRESRPAVVVVQNYVLPAIERPVAEAARAVGAELVVVVHDHVPHSVLAGTRLGLVEMLRRSDHVFTHTAMVANAVTALAPAVEVKVIPLPLPLGLLDQVGRSPSLVDKGERALALHFGILKRRYKGTSAVADLAGEGMPGWAFGLVGVGAPPVEGATSVRRFVSAAELVGTVAASEVSLLPYRFATQSGAVVLAQALGSVVVSTAVGGIPEQVEDGVTGRLLPPEAGPGALRAVFGDLSKPEARLALSTRARAHVYRAHQSFADQVAKVVARA